MNAIELKESINHIEAVELRNGWKVEAVEKNGRRHIIATGLHKCPKRAFLYDFKFDKHIAGTGEQKLWLRWVCKTHVNESRYFRLYRPAGKSYTPLLLAEYDIVNVDA